jgi:hypothetical protein
VYHAKNPLFPNVVGNQTTAPANILAKAKQIPAEQRPASGPNKLKSECAP